MRALLLTGFAFFILSPARLAPAQCCGSTIVGRVSDAQGAVIPNAKVVIINLETGHSTKLVTNQMGEYQAPPLPLGQYKVKVTTKGFKTAETMPQRLEIDKVLRFDVTLQSKTSTQP